MKKLITITSISLAILFSSNILAEGFNDNYLQVGYTSSNYKHTDKITNIKGSLEFGNNFSIRGEYIYETGDWNDPQEYETLKYDKLLIGLGKSFPISSSSDITTSISYDKWNSKKTTEFTATTIANGKTTYTTTLTNSSNKYSVIDFSVGYKNLLNPNLKLTLNNLWGRLKYITTNGDLHYFSPSIEIRNLSESGIESSAKYLKIYGATNTIQSRLEIELMKHLDNNFSIGTRVLSVKEPDYTETGIFVRRSF